MTLQQLLDQYRSISEHLNLIWPLESKDQRIFARTMKIVEELGELSDEILSSMSLQRNTKVQNFTRENLEDEFADVMGSLVLLAIELDIDITEVMKRKLSFTKHRFKISEEQV